MQGARPLALPIGFALGLAGLSALPEARQVPGVWMSLIGAAAALSLWSAVLAGRAGGRARAIAIEVVLRRQHYVQAAAQTSVLAYWGWYWPPVYESAHLILAQLLFAYAFDMLLCWSRRDTYTLGFGPFPIILSINLFLWFRPEWIYLQFVMVALGFLAKELIRWKRAGRRVHVFNPSSFPLAVVSLILLAGGASGITRGQEIAYTQFYPPHMYLVLLLVSLPGQYLFGVASMTLSAVAATYMFGLAYFAATGIYFFYDSYIPIAVFLGMHLLFNDPSTSPRTEPARIVYGVLYGLGTVLLYQLLGSVGLPTFYDKLLPVPLLNLSVRGLDRIARALTPNSRAPVRSPHQRRLIPVALSAIVFAAMSASGGVGDDHPGQWLPFWQQACREARPYACPYLADSEQNLCNQGSGWACNEAGLLHIALSRTGEDLRRRDPAGAVPLFRRGCELDFAPACENLTALTTGGGSLQTAPPGIADYPLVLRGSKAEIRTREPSLLYALACRQGWPDTC